MLPNTVRNMPNKQTARRSVSAHRVAAIVYDHLCTFEFSIVREVLGRYRIVQGAGYELQTAAAEPGPLRTNMGLVVEADCGLELLERADTVVVPGWRQPRDIPPALVRALAAAHGRGARMVSICGGAFALAEAGILDGRRATTHWHSAGDLAKRFPAVKVDADVLYVDEGNVLTSAGASAGMDLCLHIVRKDYGAEVANTVARLLVVPFHRGGSQAQYVPWPVPSDRRTRIAPVLDWIRASLAKDLTVLALSRRANMSPRTFVRHFIKTMGMAPGQWILNERLALARNLLESSTASIDDVARSCGFGTAATLRHHFRSRLKTSPTAHRRQFHHGYGEEFAAAPPNQGKPGAPLLPGV